MSMLNYFKKRKVLLIVLLLGGLLLSLNFGFKSLWVIPPFEGLRSGVQGVASYNEYVDYPNNPSFGYWGGIGPSNAQFTNDKSTPLSAPARVLIEVGDPQLSSDPLSQGQTVEYWVKLGEDDYRHIKGQINVYNLDVTISAQRTSTGPVPPVIQDYFTNIYFWFILKSEVWNQAYQEQSPVSGRPSEYGQAVEAPLAVHILYYDIKDAGNHGVVTPAYQGRFIDLYSDHYLSGIIDDLGFSEGASMNSTLTGNYLPSSLLRDKAYFPVELNNFGITYHLVGMSSPVVDYTLKVYTLQLGEFTYTNPNDTPWGERLPEKPLPFQWLVDAWNNWIQNPWNWLGLGSWAIVLILGIAAIGFFFIFGLPRGIRKR